MPEKVDPRGRLRSGAEKAAWRKQAREAHRVGDRHAGAEQVRGREYEQCPRAQDRKLAEQQHGGDQFVEHERGLIGGKKCRQWGQRHLCERRQHNEDGRRGDDHRQRKAALPVTCRNGGKKHRR